MAKIEALHDAAPTVLSGLRAHGGSAAWLALGLLAAGGLGALAFNGGSIAEPVVLGLLALLAVAGVFLVFGLLSGFLRLSDRAAEAELLKSVADGMDRGSADCRPRRHRALSQPGARSPDRHAVWPARDARGAVCRRAAVDGSLLSTQSRRGADEARDEEFFVRSGALAGRGGRWLQVSVRPLQAPSGRSKQEA